MSNKEFHHYQFIDPNSGDIPFTVTMLIRHNKKIDTDLPPLSVNELIDLNSQIELIDGNFVKLFNKTNNK